MPKKDSSKKTHRKRICPLASDHHGLLIIPIHWLASSLCLFFTNKLVCGGRSGAIWLPSHHPGGSCTLVMVEEILCKVLWVPRKALYKCNKLLLCYKKCVVVLLLDLSLAWYIEVLYYLAHIIINFFQFNRLSYSCHPCLFSSVNSGCSVSYSSDVGSQ